MLQLIGTCSWKHSLLKVNTLEKNLTGRKCLAYGARSHKIFGKITPFQRMWMWSVLILYHTVMILRKLLPISLFGPIKIYVHYMYIIIMQCTRSFAYTKYEVKIVHSRDVQRNTKKSPSVLSVRPSSCQSSGGYSLATRRLYSCIPH